MATDRLGNLAPDMSTEEQLIAAINSELIYAHMLHQTFFTLFDSGEEVARLLEDSDEQFFSLVFSMYLDAIALSFTRLLDPDKSVGKDNLSLFYLLERTDLRNHKEYAKWLAELQTLKGRAGKFIAVRNKVTGHLDFQTNINLAGTPKPSFSRQDIEEVYNLIADWLNSVRAGIGTPAWVYTIGVANFQYARPLLLRLREAKKALDRPK